MSVALEIGLDLPPRARAFLHGEDVAGWLPDLLEEIGAEAVSQTQSRIADDKAAPDGVPWTDWSEHYAETRHRGQSLLQSEGGLVDSIQHAVEGREVHVGSNLVYAATHQFGDEDRGIPARPYLGVSRDDARSLDHVIEDSWNALRR